MVPFQPVDQKVDFPALEEEVLERWKASGVFARSLAAREGAPEWFFYEGPPTANGRPGIHHVEPRTFKDVYPRYKTMTGHLVRRKGGWDCHGLPVELEVEKEIGTTGKRDIEAFGVAEFNRLCRASVQRYVGDFERLTERIGFWIDMSDAYWTMSTEYIESVWWSLKSLHQRGLLVEDHKVTAYCPRCGTALSDAEVAQGYEQVEDPSIFVRFPIVEAADPSLVGASLLVWTTTPWTLPSNTGAAVAPNASYTVAGHSGSEVIVATSLLEAVPGVTLDPSRELIGSELVGVRYDPPYPNVEGAHEVVAADFVSMEDGTGIVHLAPAFGPEDLAIGRAKGWPVWKPVGDDGRFNDDAPPFVRDVFVKDADPQIVDDLHSRGLVVSSGTHQHAYPFCWRCSTPLLYYARTSWYAKTTAVKDRLLEVNGGVNWYPEHIRDGRYGDWLRNNVDWALSRERYWGTPLPIWRCPQGHQTAVGSLKELGELAGRDLSGLDPHKPYIDEVVFGCPECAERAERVPEVIDTWYDSGAMPFAQWSYHPELGRGLADFRRSFPADFISEAIDQTRGWFYTLMAEGVLHFDETAYRNVVCLGHIVAEDGRKMSKSLGNIFDPWDALERQGADALRWFMLTNGSPWESRRIGHEILDEVVRQLLLPLWNLYGFFVTYANASGFDPTSDEAPALAERPVMDRWIGSRLASTIAEARQRLDSYDATHAGRLIQRFIDDLSSWYVRRSRRRFWNPSGTGGSDSAAAFATLWDCLVTTATLLAPFTPFISEVIWQNMASGRGGRPDSVHLTDYPPPRPDELDADLEESMETTRLVVELGRRVRVETRTRTRQPLAEAVVHLSGHRGDVSGMADLIAEDLNVKSVRFEEGAHSLGSWRAKPDFKVLGPRLGSKVKALAASLDADDGSVAAELARGERVELDLDGESIELGPGEVELSQQVREGWGIASEGGITVALELAITPELRLEGISRELIRVVQDARKEAGLDVSDRIALGIVTSGEVGESIAIHRDLIAAETLAVELVAEPVTEPTHQVETDLEGTGVAVSLRRTAYTPG
jgi:isoleucyl-tRNA synthetase